MQSELFFNKRAINRKDIHSKRKLKTPLEIITTNIVEIINSFLDTEFYNNKQILFENKININHNIINDFIETTFSEKQIKNLNPPALVASFMILGNNNNIDSKKLDFLLKKKMNNNTPIVNYFYNLNVKDEDIIRYAKLWKHILSK
jgi:hypothetical protein